MVIIVIVYTQKSRLDLTQIDVTESKSERKKRRILRERCRLIRVCVSARLHIINVHNKEDKAKTKVFKYTSVLSKKINLLSFQASSRNISAVNNKYYPY
jgi:uncharacterized protein Veg